MRLVVASRWHIGLGVASSYSRVDRADMVTLAEEEWQRGFARPFHHSSFIY